MKKILLTGAAGFIGFHLALYLQEKNHLVMGVDNFHPYYSPLLKRQRAQILSEASIELFERDIQDISFLKDLIQQKKITHIIHLAAQPGVRHPYIEDYVQSNLKGFASILEVARKTRISQLIFASSSSVYGLNEKIPFQEEDRTDNPANFYGATKQANELMAKSYFHLYQIPMVGFRFFTVYGPWGRPDMAYFQFTEALLQEKKVPLFAEGNMKRDFTFIADILPAICSALDLPPSFEIFNLGNHHPHSTFELVKYLEKRLQKKAQLQLLPTPQGEPIITFADISKAQEKLGFSPTTSLEKGLGCFVDWYEKKYLSLFIPQDEEIYELRENTSLPESFC